MPGRSRKPLTDEQREKMRQQCLERQPWKHSTGPRTPEGKRVASLNSLRHGLYAQNPALRVVGRMLVSQEDFEQALEVLVPLFEKRRLDA